MSDKNPFLRIRRITADDLPSLIQLANQDGHAVIAPTHVVVKNEQLIGFISLGALPAVMLWMDKDRAAVRDSIAVMNFFESRIEDSGGRHVLLPCTEESPYRRYLERVGYVSTGAVAFIKPLT